MQKQPARCRALRKARADLSLPLKPDLWRQLRGKNRGGFDDRGGEFQADAGAEGLLVAQDDFAAGFLNDAVADAEAEAGAFADGLGGEEGIEGAIQVAEAGAGIVEADEDAIALARGGY